jgi:hypothetical protein
MCSVAGLLAPFPPHARMDWWPIFPLAALLLLLLLLPMCLSGLVA